MMKIDKEYLLEQARLLFEEDLYEEVNLLYSQVDSQLNDVDDLRRYSYCLIEIGDYERALSIMLDWESMEKNNPVLYSMKAHVLKKVGDLLGAEKALNKSIQIKPRASGYCVLGDLLRMMGKNEAAQGCYRAALRIDPSYKEAYMALEDMP